MVWEKPFCVTATKNINAEISQVYYLYDHKILKYCIPFKIKEGEFSSAETRDVLEKLDISQEGCFLVEIFEDQLNPIFTYSNISIDSVWAAKDRMDWQLNISFSFVGEDTKKREYLLGNYFLHDSRLKKLESMPPYRVHLDYQKYGPGFTLIPEADNRKYCYTLEGKSCKLLKNINLDWVNAVGFNAIALSSKTPLPISIYSVDETECYTHNAFMRYCALPFTIAADVITSPVLIVMFFYALLTGQIVPR
jgi:hypothetical protein